MTGCLQEIRDVQLTTEQNKVQSMTAHNRAQQARRVHCRASLYTAEPGCAGLEPAEQGCAGLKPQQSRGGRRQKIVSSFPPDREGGTKVKTAQGEAAKS